MDKDILKYLAKNNYLKEKLEVIDNLIKKQEYKEAYFKLSAILEFINVKYIKHKYNINMPNSTVINIVNTYEDRDEKLFKEMLAINAEYSQIDTNDVTMNDVEYLAGMVDTIYEYMLKSTGEFI